MKFNMDTSVGEALKRKDYTGKLRDAETVMRSLEGAVGKEVPIW